MMRKLKDKLVNTQNLLWLALILALLGSLRHVAWGFSTLENGDLFYGYIQAIAVDLGLLALAIGIQRARAGERAALSRWLWIGAGFFAVISVYANLLHGLVFESPIQLQRNWGQFGLVMILARPFLLSGVLPLMVIYLSEVVAVNYNYRESQESRTDEAASLAIPVEIQAQVFCDVWRERHQREPTVPEFVHYFREQTGHQVAEEQADQYILDWRSERGLSGARPRKPVLPVPEYSPNGSGK